MGVIQMEKSQSEFIMSMDKTVKIVLNIYIYRMKVRAKTTEQNWS